MGVNKITNYDIFEIGLFLLSLIILMNSFIINHNNIVSCVETKGNHNWVCDRNIYFFMFMISYQLLVILTIISYINN